ncbi:MAG: amidohydrolase [Pseudomonadales bacterium]|nr:amidohydrolase [Pseudomonadales bacterium]
MRLICLLVLGIVTTGTNANTLVTGGPIYTSVSEMPTAEAVVYDGDRITFVGGLKAAQRFTDDKTEVIDLAGKTMTAGFIESHGHIMGLGFSMQRLDLSDATSWDEVVARVAAAASKAAPGEWITGRGWHQSKWTPQPAKMVKGFQVHDKLSAATPDNPVYLVHASGHAALANSVAMQTAGINAETEFTGDGEVIKDEHSQPTGIFNERAQELIAKHVPPPSEKQAREALALALGEMASNGITTFQDAGSGRQEIALIKQFLKEGKLTSRLWVMLAGWDENLLLDWYRTGPEIGLGDNRLTIRAIKLIADGALGSRGAWLLEPYADRPGHVGLPTMTPEYMQRVSEAAFQHNFQVCVHAIGDRANREVLDIFERVQSGRDQGVRFRVEHAQHLSPADIPRFGKLGVIASMQGVHLSSDRPWAIDRLGKQRIEQGAYVWRKLVDSGAILINGTDVPVEPINPIASFYALVTRKTLAGEPPGGYEPSQKLTREEALASYTRHAAYGAFEEHIKGSIEAGKLADFTVFDQDIMQVDEDKLLETRVAATIVGGKVIYRRAP